MIGELLKYSTEQLKSELRRRDIEYARKLDSRRRNELIKLVDGLSNNEYEVEYCGICRQPICVITTKVDARAYLDTECDCNRLNLR